MMSCEGGIVTGLVYGVLGVSVENSENELLLIFSDVQQVWYQHEV